MKIAITACVGLIPASWNRSQSINKLAIEFFGILDRVQMYEKTKLSTKVI